MNCDTNTTTCCGAKCSSPPNCTECITFHKSACTFVLAFKTLTHDKVSSRFRVVINDVRTDIDDLGDDYYTSHFNINANIFTPG